jgi:hypothetical protein
MTRKEFLSASAALAAGAALGQSGKTKTASSSGSISRGQPPPRNRHPYKGIDWSTAHQIRGTTHVHCRDQAALDVILKRIEFLTLSNYYPSAPWYPLAKMTENYYRVHHDFPVMVNGKREAGPFDWNAIVGSWRRELTPESYKKGPFPFKEGAPLFKPLPEGVLEAPNAEHHGFRLDNGKFAANLHMCAPGSAYASGTFDARNIFKTWSHAGYYFGSGEKWRIAVDRMIAGLVHPDGGGVTINHPLWSKLDRSLMLEILDYDPRVLGIEVLSSGRNNEVYWDWALASGRQCFGFFVPDWGIKKEIFGVNVLCVEERTVHACMKAYREGNFYGAAHGLDELSFTHISFDGKCVKAATDKPAVFEVVTALGVVKKSEGREIVWDVVPDGNSAGPRVDVFARIRATAADGCGEVLYSQPFMLY